ncbi:AtpZ protein [Bacillus sp. HMF5848]|uniref:AtpZ/AtpI family protein n=1 Tax=Bacillus sp. HMF5848 TaxID=2495421 RepID=UPI000F76EACD|nr:AtpZ/AtpI family protein [Bacillus sp. HMF5848]RSK28948.1 AtpZ protein [Bacillus sp. HMF5848]
MSSGKQNPWRAMVLVSIISSYIVGGVVVGVWLGLWIDSLFGTRPLFLVVFLLLGMFSGAYGVYQAVKPFIER